MKMPSYSSRDMAIRADAYLAKVLQTPTPESPFQVGDSQLKAIRELAKIFDADTKIPNKDALTTPPLSLIKKSAKLPRVEYQTAPPPRVNLYEESKKREQKLPSPIQTTLPSAETRETYTLFFKELVKQRCCGHYTGNKYDLTQETHP